MLHLLRLKGMPIVQQLHLEEALLRADERNWCLLNDGTPPAIVMGISGKPEQLINQPLIQQKPIPVIRRFSGGGAVVVDSYTFFVTWIFNNTSVQIRPFPEHVLKWTEPFYREILPCAQLRENDYVIGDRKFGGNAQYFRKQRWLHHSTLLWDFDPKRMDYLLMPPKMPQYRQNRSHSDFLCKLKDYCSKKEFEEKILNSIMTRFEVKEMEVSHLSDLLISPHRQATKEVGFTDEGGLFF
jgi:lipoate-protein ligase A